MSKNKWLQGALILSIAGIVAKLFSAFFRIPLWYVIGDAGMGGYQTVYPVLLIVTGFVTAGYQTYLARELAADSSGFNVNNWRSYDYLFKKLGIMLTLLFIGIVAGICIFYQLMNGKFDQTMLIGIALVGMGSVPYFVARNGVQKAYFQGSQEMLPLGIANVLESFSKFLFGLGLAYLFFRMTHQLLWALFGAAFGTTLGFIISFIYLRTRLNKRSTCNQIIKIKLPWKSITLGVIPITLLMMTYTLMNVLDSVGILLLNQNTSMNEGAISAIEQVGQMAKAYSVFNLPLTLALAIVMSIIPATAQKNSDLKSQSQSVFLLGSLLGIPAGMGLLVLAPEIMGFLYSDNILGFRELQAYGVTLFILMPTQAVIGVLISRNQINKLSKALLFGILFKIVLMLTFWQINQHTLVPAQAIMTSLISYSMLVIIGIYELRKTFQIRLNVIHGFIKPMIAAAGMAGAIILCNHFLGKSMLNHKIYLLFLILIGVTIYSILILLLKVIRIQDIKERQVFK